MNHEFLEDLLSSAKAAGADTAEAVLAQRQALAVNVRLGELEEVEREEARDIGLRVFVGRRQATVAGSDISKDAVSTLVERAVAMAKLAPEDQYAGLVPADLLAKGPFPDLQLFDSTETAAEALEAQAREIEDAARAVKGVTNSEGGSASWSASRWLLSTTEGFSGDHKATSFSAYASVIAGNGETMERGGEGRTTRWQADLPAMDIMGKEAGRQAVNMLGARKIKSATAPIIIDSKIAPTLLGPFVGAISGPSVARGVSFLKDRLGKSIFGERINITEEPHRLRGLGSSPHDDEGVATVDRKLVENGVLTTWLMNMSSARQLGMAPTGHAARSMAGPSGVAPNNMTLQPGDRDQKGLMADAGKGLFVTSMFGPSLNANTGDWSVGVSGFWFEGGEIAHPVNEITIAGNLVDLYGRLVPGSDLEIRGRTNAPSLLIDKVAIAGQ